MERRSGRDGTRDAADEIRRRFAARDLDEESRRYLEVHATRYAYLLGVVEDARAQVARPVIRIADIGPSFFTEVLRERFPADAIVSVGFAHDGSRGGHLPPCVDHDGRAFFAFDLNDSQDPARWIAIPPCEIVVMAEVIEHLCTAPGLVLRFVDSFLAPGGLLVIQTPNAATLQNRIRLLLGRNPFEMLRETRDNPGHFREYTLAELLALGRASGLAVRRHDIRDYFAYDTPARRLYQRMKRLLPPAFRDGITIVFEKRAAPAR